MKVKYNGPINPGMLVCHVSDTECTTKMLVLKIKEEILETDDRYGSPCKIKCSWVRNGIYEKHSFKPIELVIVNTDTLKLL